MEENKDNKIITVEEKEPEMEVDDSGYYIEKGLIPPKLRSPNGCIGDPERQQRAWEYYIQSWKEGRPNVIQSGLKAGYPHATAQNLNNFKWFKDKKDKLRRSNMMTKAERNLSRILNLDYSKIIPLPDGSTKEGVDVDTLRIVADISKTVVTTLGKDLGYSTKTEVGGKMESEIKINSVSYADPILIENTAVDEGVKQLEVVQEKIVEDI
jgi:hypothetical protein